MSTLKINSIGKTVSQNQKLNTVGGSTGDPDIKKIKIIRTGPKQK